MKITKKPTFPTQTCPVCGEELSDILEDVTDTNVGDKDKWQKLKEWLKCCLARTEFTSNDIRKQYILKELLDKMAEFEGGENK